MVQARKQQESKTVIDGSLIKDLRQRRGMSQRELAKAIGRSPGDVSREENNLRRIRYIDHVLAYAKALEISPRYLLGDQHWRDLVKPELAAVIESMPTEDQERLLDLLTRPLATAAAR